MDKKKTKRFYEKLDKLSQEAKDHPENFIPLEDFLKRYPITQPTDEADTYEKRPPKHCPSCGSINIHNQELRSRHPTSELYDAYCRDCQWSGDISPDISLNKGEKKTLHEIISIIKNLKPHLAQQYGVETIGVFGSWVTGKQTPKSDIDILVTFKEEAYPGLFEFMNLEEFLSKQLGVKSRFGFKKALKPHIGKRILEEVVNV
ncbi:MAG: nucleotidyltransferase family protein [Candidatus Bathyarchaeota archaeon]|nr:nucleotidyltransferase family protein [Candidatus Bathyarchaeota archaeon]